MLSPRRHAAVRIEALAKIDVSQNTGATARLFDFCEHLAAANQVRVWLQRKPVPAALRSTPGIEVRLLPAPTPHDSPDALKALKAASYEVLLALQMAGTFVRRGRADAIYMREVATVAPTVVGGVFGVPRFIEIDGYPYREALRLGGPFQRIRASIMRWQARRCAGIVTFSEAQAQVMMSDYGVPAERILTMSNGADLVRFRPLEREGAIAALGLDPHFEYIVWAGSLRPNQDIPVLLEGFRLLSEARPRVRLLLLASAVAELEEAARAAGVAEAVIARHVDHWDVSKYLAVASVCVATLTDTPRHRDNAVAPLKVFEYLACARPVVTADLPWVRFIEEEGFGRLYTASDPVSLARQLVTLLDLPDSERASIGEHARAYVEEHHDWRKLNGACEAFMRERIAASRGQRSN
jgi:glycosyltransferase involved in cell wall biosynthesis